MKITMIFKILTIAFLITFTNTLSSDKLNLKRKRKIKNSPLQKTNSMEINYQNPIQNPTLTRTNSSPIKDEQCNIFSCDSQNDPYQCMIQICQFPKCQRQLQCKKITNIQQLFTIEGNNLNAIQDLQALFRNPKGKELIFMLNLLMNEKFKKNYQTYQVRRQPRNMEDFNEKRKIQIRINHGETSFNHLEDQEFGKDTIININIEYPDNINPHTSITSTIGSKVTIGNQQYYKIGTKAFPYYLTIGHELIHAYHYLINPITYKTNLHLHQIAPNIYTGKHTQRASAIFTTNEEFLTIIGNIATNKPTEYLLRIAGNFEPRFGHGTTQFYECENNVNQLFPGVNFIDTIDFTFDDEDAMQRVLFSCLPIQQNQNQAMNFNFKKKIK